MSTAYTQEEIHTITEEPISERYARCANCDGTWSISEWSERCVYDMDELIGKLSRIAHLSPDELMNYVSDVSKNTVWTCPNGCDNSEDSGEVEFFDPPAYYSCNNDEYDYGTAHDAWLCCNLVYSHSHEPQDRCTSVFGQPYNGSGYRCKCHHTCDKIWCARCHNAYDQDFFDKHHSCSMDIGYEPIQGHGVTVTVVPQVKPDCIICGSYCCAVHKTHHYPHALCWE